VRARVIVFAKAPVAGHVKTRLARSVGGARALELYRWLGATVIAQLRDPRWELWVAFTPSAERGHVEAWLGPADRWTPQPDGDLGERLAAAVSAAFAAGDGPVLLVGTDCLALTAERVAEALSALATHDAALGPARDGGYYLLGMTRALAVFDGVAWSTSAVAEHTRARLREAGATWVELQTEVDVDEAADLDSVGDRDDAPAWERPPRRG
jgi:uncharacterized protein